MNLKNIHLMKQDINQHIRYDFVYNQVQKWVKLSMLFMDKHIDGIKKIKGNIFIPVRYVTSWDIRHFDQRTIYAGCGRVLQSDLGDG